LRGKVHKFDDLAAFADDIRVYLLLALAEFRKPLVIMRCRDELTPQGIKIFLKVVKFLFMWKI